MLVCAPHLRRFFHSSLLVVRQTQWSWFSLQLSDFPKILPFWMGAIEFQQPFSHLWKVCDTVLTGQLHIHRHLVTKQFLTLNQNTFAYWHSPQNVTVRHDEAPTDWLRACVTFFLIILVLVPEPQDRDKQVLSWDESMSILYWDWHVWVFSTIIKMKIYKLGHILYSNLLL